MGRPLTVKIKCKGSRNELLTKLRVIQGGLKDLSKANAAKLRKRIETKGFDAPFFVWRNNILDGTQRKKVLEEMIADGWTLPGGKVPVCEISARTLTEAKDRLLGYVSQYGKVTMEGLDGFRLNIPDAVIDLDTIDIPDFNLEKFRLKYLADPEQEKKEDVVPDPPKKAKTKQGDLYILGDHRLLCGDATKAEDVKILMDGKKADMVFTDPPYGVGYQMNETVASLKKRNRRLDGKVVTNDALGEADLHKLLSAALAVIPLKKGGVFYMMAPAGPPETTFRNALKGDSELFLKACVVWVKDVFVFGRQDYHYRHESMLYGWRKGQAHYYVDDRTQDSVWEIPRPRESKMHPTMKPVALVQKAISNSSRSAERVCDPFLGSGTTIIAAEKLERKCYGMEIDPIYCDVIVARWEEYTGKKAQRKR